MLTIIAALLAMGSPEGAQPELPGWMAGCWEQRTGDSWTEECWTRPRGGMMMGSSRSGTGGVTTEWETMQIIREDTDDPAIPRMAFWASPGGAGRTMFSWIPSVQSGVTFINRGHDYPQRIRYWREGADLMAEIATADGGRKREWRYRRVKP